MKRLLAVLIAALLGSLAFAEVFYDHYNKGTMTFDITADVPTDLNVSSIAYELYIPADHMHPGNEFRVVINVTNDSDRDVIFWSADLPNMLLTNPAWGEYLTVESGPTDPVSAVTVDANMSGELTFAIKVSDDLPHDYFDATPLVGQFLIGFEGVINVNDTDITNGL